MFTTPELQAIVDFLHEHGAPEAYMRDDPGSSPLATGHTELKLILRDRVYEEHAAEVAGDDAVLGSRLGPAQSSQDRPES